MVMCDLQVITRASSNNANLVAGTIICILPFQKIFFKILQTISKFFIILKFGPYFWTPAKYLNFTRITSTILHAHNLQLSVKTGLSFYVYIDWVLCTKKRLCYLLEIWNTATLFYLIRQHSLNPCNETKLTWYISFCMVTVNVRLVRTRARLFYISGSQTFSLRCLWKICWTCKAPEIII